MLAYTNAVAMESPTSTMQVQNDLYSECDNKYDVCILRNFCALKMLFLFHFS